MGYRSVTWFEVTEELPLSSGARTHARMHACRQPLVGMSTDYMMEEEAVVIPGLELKQHKSSDREGSE